MVPAALGADRPGGLGRSCVTERPAGSGRRTFHDGPADGE